MAEERVQRRLAAILATNVVGYSQLMSLDEAGTHARFNTHLNELIEPPIERLRGRFGKTTGDAFLVEFASVVDAVECAVAIQKDMAERTNQSGTASTKWKSQDVTNAEPFEPFGINRLVRSATVNSNPFPQSR